MKSHCKLGHEYTPENTYIHPNDPKSYSCKTCKKLKAKLRAKDPIFRERIRQYRLNNGDKFREYRKRTWRKYQMKLYGYSEEQYAAQLAKQNGVCAICRKPPIKENLAVDHDHRCCPGGVSCGKCIRGLIHNNCNTAIGQLGDDPTICRLAAEYLEHPPAQENHA